MSLLPFSSDSPRLFVGVEANTGGPTNIINSSLTRADEAQFILDRFPPSAGQVAPLIQY
jgi:hypothetical protein